MKKIKHLENIEEAIGDLKIELIKQRKEVKRMYDEDYHLKTIEKAFFKAQEIEATIKNMQKAFDSITKF